MIFNERLRALRKEKGWTQPQTAEKLSIAYRNYQRLEADGNTPNFANLVQIADLFGVSMDYLAGRTDRREVNGSAGHDIIITSDLAEDTAELETLLRKVIPAALEAEGVALPCEVNVLLTGNEGIHAINLAQREVDAPTDVLSFPMLELTPGDKPTEEDMEPGSGRVPLGDMVLNIDRIRSQGEEYGHGFRREAAYLAVHSVLHLLGYDHMDEGPMKKQMRSREEAILAQLDITRG